MIATSVGNWINASRLWGELETWYDVLFAQKQPFALLKLQSNHDVIPYDHHNTAIVMQTFRFQKLKTE